MGTRGQIDLCHPYWYTTQGSGMSADLQTVKDEAAIDMSTETKAISWVG